jgi:hypothetical protein
MQLVSGLMQGSLAVLGVVLAGLLSVFVPAQSKRVSRVAVEQHADACMGLTAAECCAQSIELAVFRATGDQVPKAAKTPVRLSCADPTAVVPEGACRSIAIARGFGAKQAGLLCEAATLGKRCNGSPSCKTCSQELAKLKFQNAERACLAATHVATVGDDREQVIILQDDKPATTNGDTFEIRKRRTVQR